VLFSVASNIPRLAGSRGRRRLVNGTAKRPVLVIYIHDSGNITATYVEGVTERGVKRRKRASRRLSKKTYENTYIQQVIE